MSMAAKNSYNTKKRTNRGTWTAEEDQKLAQAIQTHGAKKWRSVADTAGLNRCGKSCRLRWLNYLRPNIKRGNISDEEEDLIIRLHRLLGNRWSLIAGRLPGRTDNDIKNYWNSHLGKKLRQQKKKSFDAKTQRSEMEMEKVEENMGREEEGKTKTEGNSSRMGLVGNKDDDDDDDDDEVFGCCEGEGPLNLEWMRKFLEVDES